MKLIITEGQLNMLMLEEQFNSTGQILEATERDNAKKIAGRLFGEKNPMNIYKAIASQLRKKTITFMAVPLILGMVIGGGVERSGIREKLAQRLENVWEKVKTSDEKVTDIMQTNSEEQAGMWKNNLGRWKTVSSDVIATVYNAVPAQCNNDVQHTASMFKLNLSDVLSQRVIAMERTFMKELGLKYGDVIYIEGTGKWDGPWQIQDTMNKRFAGMHKIDILVPRNIRTGKWSDVRISVPADEKTMANAKSTMKGSV